MQRYNLPGKGGTWCRVITARGGGGRKDSRHYNGLEVAEGRMQHYNLAGKGDSVSSYNMADRGGRRKD
jgi:hypothetical protein